MTTSAHSPSLPAPRLTRWQPLRSGLVNLYRYDYEEFHFEDGRLLLRGDNGSGKSRILALQLPFLLDGEISPARIEPDADPAKRIEWNLLMGRHPDRTGYTWIEFGRREEDGTEHFVTLGCGLRAVAGQGGLHSRWLFVTRQRIGRDLFLQTAQRIPLGRERLTEALGADGQVYPKVEDYRRAVDEALFGLGPRYGPLLELLLRLRRPQLTRKLEEAELSQTLSDALPTLPGSIIDEMAEAFRSLEADRDTLREFTEARSAVENFLREYGLYIRTAVRRSGAAVRSTHAAYEAAQRAAREAAQRFDSAAAGLASLKLAHGELETRFAGAESGARTLRDSPEMRTASDIRLAGEAAQQAATQLAQAEADEQAAAGTTARLLERQHTAEEDAATIAGKLARHHGAAEAAAIAAALAEPHRSHLPPLPAEPARTAEAALERLVTHRQQAIATLVRHEHVVAETRRALALAEEAHRAADTAAAAAREREHDARTDLDRQAESSLAAYTAWRATAHHLQPPAPDTLADALADWLAQREGASPLRSAAEAAHRESLDRFAHREAALANERTEAVLALQELDTGIAQLEQGVATPPPPPPTRRAERAGRPGAPLWQVCDFRPEVPATARAGFEAALQAAGLLDAWILPDGRLLAGEEDTFLFVAENSASLLSAESLAAVLMPAINRETATADSLDEATVLGVLTRLGCRAGSGVHWIGDDGAWRLGPLTGRWSKPTAEFVGESTRATARRLQLADLRTRRAETAANRTRIEQSLDTLAQERTAAGVEAETAPGDEPLLRAGFTLEAATRAVVDSLAESERAAQVALLRRQEHELQAATLDRDAADLHLTAWLGRLDELKQHTFDYARALAALWPTAHHAATVQAQLAALGEQVTVAQSELETRRARRSDSAAQAEVARQRFATLQEMYGQTVAAVLAKLAEAEAIVAQLKDSLAANQIAQIAGTAAHAKAEADRTHAEQARLGHEASRRAAIDRLQQLAEQRLLAEADPELREVAAGGWSVAHAVDLARRLESLLASSADNDEESWKRRQDAIHGHIQELRDRLIRHGHQPEIHSSAELVLVRCLFQGRPHSMTELHDAFASELTARERLLQAREREIIEEHLLAEVAVELQKLIRAAEDWRASANTELNSRPTSSGVRFRFQWEPATETRFREVRPVLLRRGELWTPAERAALAGFLQGRIAAEQEDDESGSWRDHLAHALDYRRWHRFVVERQQDGQWRRLDRMNFGTGSSGEKALALTLPRFAAASAHYRSAPTAPRLVLLDEAFAGIDPTMRGQCMGVLKQFDLDVVMTSEHEWGCYPTVPALAIYHLTTLPGVDAVAATRWLWNGREKRRLAPPPPQEIPPEAQPLPGDETLLPPDGAQPPDQLFPSDA